VLTEEDTTVLIGTEGKPGFYCNAALALAKLKPAYTARP